MALRLGINIGFVTNSSSVVHHFPAEVLNDPTVKMFLEKFEISGGFVGSDLWHRGHCATFAVTKDQKKQVQQNLQSINDGREEEGGYQTSVPGISTEDDSVVVIYGDEYTSMASTLSHLLSEAAKRLGLGDLGYGASYN
jgi:hypothetical protein